MGYLLIGMCAGFVGVIVTLLLGKSFGTALFVYVAVGIVTMLGLTFLLGAVRRLSRSAEAEGKASEQLAIIRAPIVADAAATRLEPVMRVLAVDDDPLILDLIPMIAAQAGRIEVVAANSASAAIDALRAAAPFDCIMLDIEMPGMNGVDLCAQIRTMPGYGLCPIFMLTAKTDVSYLDQAFKSGATDYVTKPFDVLELGRLLKAQHDRHAERKDRSEPAVAGRVAEPSTVVLANDGLSHFIDLEALTTYIDRLSSQAVEKVSTVAVKISHFESAEALRSGEPVKRVIQDVAATISAVFETTGFVGAYAGDGEFVLLCSKDTLTNLAKLEADTHYLLHHKGCKWVAGAGRPIEISFGSPVAPPKARKGRAQQAIHAALGLSRRREAAAEVLNFPRHRKI